MTINSVSLARPVSEPRPPLLRREPLTREDQPRSRSHAPRCSDFLSPDYWFFYLTDLYLMRCDPTPESAVIMHYLFQAGTPSSTPCNQILPVRLERARGSEMLGAARCIFGPYSGRGAGCDGPPARIARSVSHSNGREPVFCRPGSRRRRYCPLRGERAAARNVTAVRWFITGWPLIPGATAKRTVCHVGGRHGLADRLAHRRGCVFPGHCTTGSALHRAVVFVSPRRVVSGG